MRTMDGSHVSDSACNTARERKEGCEQCVMKSGVRSHQHQQCVKIGRISASGLQQTMRTKKAANFALVFAMITLLDVTSGSRQSHARGLLGFNGLGLSSPQGFLAGWLNRANTQTSYVSLSTIKVISTVDVWTSCYLEPSSSSQHRHLDDADELFMGRELVEFQFSHPSSPDLSPGLEAGEPSEFLAEEYNEYRILSPDIQDELDIFPEILPDDGTSTSDQVISTSPIDSFARQHTSDFYVVDVGNSNADSVPEEKPTSVADAAQQHHAVQQLLQLKQQQLSSLGSSVTSLGQNLNGLIGGSRPGWWPGRRRSTQQTVLVGVIKTKIYTRLELKTATVTRKAFCPLCTPCSPALTGDSAQEEVNNSQASLMQLQDQQALYESFYPDENKVLTADEEQKKLNIRPSSPVRPESPLQKPNQYNSQQPPYSFSSSSGNTGAALQNQFQLPEIIPIKHNLHGDGERNTPQQPTPENEGHAHGSVNMNIQMQFGETPTSTQEENDNVEFYHHVHSYIHPQMPITTSFNRGMQQSPLVANGFGLPSSPEHVLNIGPHFDPYQTPIFQQFNRPQVAVSNVPDHQEPPTGYPQKKPQPNPGYVPEWLQTSDQFAIPVAQQTLQNKKKPNQKPYHNRNEPTEAPKGELTTLTPVREEYPPPPSTGPKPIGYYPPNPSINLQQKIIIHVYGLPGGSEVSSHVQKEPAVFEMTPEELPSFMAEMEKMTEDQGSVGHQGSAIHSQPYVFHGKAPSTKVPMSMKVFLMQDGENKNSDPGQSTEEMREIMLIHVPIGNGDGNVGDKDFYGQVEQTPATTTMSTRKRPTRKPQNQENQDGKGGVNNNSQGQLQQPSSGVPAETLTPAQVLHILMDMLNWSDRNKTSVQEGVQGKPGNNHPGSSNSQPAQPPTPKPFMLHQKAPSSAPQSNKVTRPGSVNINIPSQQNEKQGVKKGQQSQQQQKKPEANEEQAFYMNGIPSRLAPWLSSRPAVQNKGQPNGQTDIKVTAHITINRGRVEGESSVGSPNDEQKDGGEQDSAGENPDTTQKSSALHKWRSPDDERNFGKGKTFQRRALSSILDPPESDPQIRRWQRRGQPILTLQRMRKIAPRSHRRKIQENNRKKIDLTLVLEDEGRERKRWMSALV